MQAEESQKMEDHWGICGHHWSCAINHLHKTAHVTIVIHALISQSVPPPTDYLPSHYHLYHYVTGLGG